MLNNIKIELFESINILYELAVKGSSSFPDETCRYLTNEFNLNFTILTEENDKNSFVVLGKSSKATYPYLNKTFSVEDYDALMDSAKYEHDLIGECKLSIDYSSPNIQSTVIFTDESKKFVLLLEHKIAPSESDKIKYYAILKFVQNMLRIWVKNPQSQLANTNIKSVEFLDKSTKGLIKEIKTISGLLTLIKEEHVSNSIDKYLNEIKSINHFMLESINDLSTLLSLENSMLKTSDSKFILKDAFESLFEIIKTNHENVIFEPKNIITDEIICDKSIFDFIVLNAISFVTTISTSKHIMFDSKLSSDNKLKISISTESLAHSIDKLNKLMDPFENKELSKNQSGLALTLIAKYVEFVHGSIKFNEDSNVFSLNLSLPIKFNNSNFDDEIVSSVSLDNKDKILVIESDNASSFLLRTYLSKWNYNTKIVNSGVDALKLVKKNKYVAVILNIEQQNENSLEILQNIKSNKSTRNTPVIVFSVEVEKEKIYLMGSVEYLVKPINYNNLVEILTSYKLMRNSTVLCVDDDQPTLNLVKQAVQTAGFNVVAEHRSELVVDLISDKELDLAIIDLDMPKLNGFELIKKIKSMDSFSKLPIIIYTGKDDYQEDLQNIDGMFVDLLEKKSTSFDELEDTIIAMIKTYEEPATIEEVTDQSTGPKILMAEDYKHSQIIVTRLLKKSGFENLIVVENGQEALDICENDKIDLILMDMQMPVMNGFEATGKIRELEGYADTPIIALTAFAMKGDREKCIEAGVTDYIPKPIDSKEFIEKVKYYTQISIVT